MTQHAQPAASAPPAADDSFHPETAATSRLGRRALELLAALLLVGVVALLLLPVARAQTPGASPDKVELRIGYQKAASLLVLQKAQGTLEKRLAPLGATVKWIEFPAGPQLLEGLNLGSVDVGYVGEAPPIFAQAAGAQFAYIGYDPASPEAEAILVPKDSAIKSVADLKGKKIALNKGSNVHYLLVKLLEKNRLSLNDVQWVYLPPADARAAFESRNVDAWAIWDPFAAAAEKAIGARVLANGTGVVNNYLYYLGARSSVAKHPKVIQALFDDSVERGNWLKANVKKAAEVIAPLQGLPVEVVEVSLKRYEFNVKPVPDSVIADQQKLADTFFDLKLIPKAIAVRDAAYRPAP